MKEEKLYESAVNILDVVFRVAHEKGVSNATAFEAVKTALLNEQLSEVNYNLRNIQDCFDAVKSAILLAR